MCVNIDRICGDINNDGRVDVLDLVGFVNIIVMGDPVTDNCGDFNSDGELNVQDIVILISYILDTANTENWYELTCPPTYFGCMDSEADNYDYNANIDDGSCDYDGEDCDNILSFGVCEYLAETYGCDWFLGDIEQDDPDTSELTVGEACPNYCNMCDEVIDVDIEGCMDESANNYNPDATVDDGTCEYDDSDCFDTLAYCQYYADSYGCGYYLGGGYGTVSDSCPVTCGEC